MTIRAQSADGVIHEFPDGTNPAVIDGAMRAYAVSKATKPNKGLGGYLASEVGGAVGGAFNQLKTDAKGVWDAAGQTPPANPFSVAAQKKQITDLGRTGRMALDVGNLALSPIAGVAHAVVVNPLTSAINATPVPVYTNPGVVGLLRGEQPQRLEGDARRAQIERDVNRAVSAVGPGRGGVAPVPAKVAAQPALAESVAAFDKAGVRPSLAAMTEGKATVAKAMAENPIAGIRARKALKGSLADTAKATDRVAGQYGRPYADRAQAGEAVQRNIRDFNDRFSTRASNLYDPAFAQINAGEQNLVATAGNKPIIEPTETLRVLDSAAGRVNSKALSSLIVDPKFGEMASAIRGDANNVRFNDLRAMRTWVREAKANPELRKGIDEATLSRLEGALTQDIYTNADKVAGPAAVRNLKRADTFYRIGTERIRDGLQQFLGTNKPTSGESAYDLIIRTATDKGGADTAKLAKLRKSLQPHEWNDVSATVVSRLGKPPAGTAGDFSIDRFVSGYDGLSPQGRDLLFGNGELRNSLENLVRVGRMQKRIEAASNHSKSAVTTQTVGTVAGLANPVTAIPTAKLLTGMAITGEMMTNPTIVRWLARLSQAKAAGGAALSAQVRALASAANDNAALLPLAEQARLLLSQPQGVAAPLAAQDKQQQK